MVKELREINDLTREELLSFIKDISIRWLAHDGLWFQAVEKKFDMDTAIEMDEKAWESFTVVEAKRIMAFHGLSENGGLEALVKALNFRLYATINEQEVVWINPNKIIFRMNKCRVQVARDRKSMEPFPCKSVGIIEYSGFARTIDSRIKTRCITCPPEEHPAEYYCAWEFSIDE